MQDLGPESRQGEFAGFRRLDYVKLTVLGLGLSGLWTSLHSIILPVRLLDFVPEALKNSYLGYLTFAGLLVAMAVQPVVGAASDRAGFRWGRRRPYILAGTVAALVLLPGIGLVGSYAAVFAGYCLLQVATNAAQGPYQGLLPDLAPPSRRGVASGVKSLLELIGGVGLARLAAYFMDRYAPGNEEYWLWLTLGTLGAVLLVTALVTLLTVREAPGVPTARPPLLPSLIDSFRLDVRRSRAFLHLLVARGLLTIPGVILQTFALYYIIDVVGVDNPAAMTANLLVAVGAGLLSVVWVAGRLSDRIGRKPIMVASGLVGALGIGLLFTAGNTAQLMAAGAVLGIAGGALLSTGWALAIDLIPAGEGARYLGLANLSLAAGSALARLVGPVIDFFNGVGENLGYSVMLGICLVCFLAGAVVVARLPLSRSDD